MFVLSLKEIIIIIIIIPEILFFLFIACGDVIMDRLRREIVQNLIQNPTKSLFRYSDIFPIIPL